MQNDFVRPNGRLTIYPEKTDGSYFSYLSASKLTLSVRRIKEKFDEAVRNGNKDILWINTLDFHSQWDSELSDEPDFVKTFPPHCIAGSWGAQNVQGLELIDPDFINHYGAGFVNEADLQSTTQELVFTKDVFSIWDGNPNFRELMQFFVKEDTEIYIFGVTTQICVHAAVKGFFENFKNPKVFVVEDCIAPIQEIPVDPVYDEWKQLGISGFIKQNEVII